MLFYALDHGDLFSVTGRGVEDDQENDEEGARYVKRRVAKPGSRFDTTIVRKLVSRVLDSAVVCGQDLRNIKRRSTIG